MESFNGIKYYVIFIDYFTKYIWFYPLNKKSSVHTIFIYFKALVEKFFNTSIVRLYTNNGNEYLALKDFMTLLGIFHLTTLTHTR